MKIIMISVDYPPTVGGIAAHVHELSRAIVRLGHQVAVLTRSLPGGTARQQENGIKLHEIPLRFASPLYGIQIRREARRMMAAFRPDIIHIHGMGPLEWYNIREIPLAYTNHTSGYLRRVRKGGRLRMVFLKRLLVKPQLFLAPSQELLETPFPIPGRKVFIANGIDSTRCRFDGEARIRLRRELGFTENDRVGILTRRLVEKNGVIFLARATRLIRDDRLRLLLIGDGPERTAVETELTAHLPGRFRMLGSLRHEEIIPYYSAADFSVLPSLMEATSISGLEAMSCCLPVVGTRVGGIPELIRDGENGFLCASADEDDLAIAINRMLAADMPAMGEISRKFAHECFDWSAIARETLAAYESIIS